MSPKGFYKLCTLLCLCAYIGLYYHLYFAGQGGFTPCLSKFFFHLPCPACGTTRGIVMLLHAQPLDALQMNPNSFLVLLALLVMTVLLLQMPFQVVTDCTVFIYMLISCCTISIFLSPFSFLNY